MAIIVLQVLGWLVFLAGTLVLGAWLRRSPRKGSAEAASRVLHLLFWVGTFPPGAFGILYPGLAGFDQELGLKSLPGQPAARILGMVALLIGVHLILVSNLALMHFGEGAGAFWLTKRPVVRTIYGRVRNPMSLGLYLMSAGVGLLAGLTYFTLGTLLGVIPVHVFYLKYFEEYELELRLGQSYVDYKQRVPFLLPRLILRKR